MKPDVKNIQLWDAQISLIQQILVIGSKAKIPDNVKNYHWVVTMVQRAKRLKTSNWEMLRFFGFKEILQSEN